MKFDVCIGNPPYHYETGRRKIPLYNKFIMELTGNNPISNKVCLITPDGFIKGGQQLEPLRNHMIETKHLKSVEFHQEPVFNDASVKAAITCFDNTQTFDEVNETIVYEDLHKENKILDWYYRDVVINDTKYNILKLFKTKINAAQSIASLITGLATRGFNTKCFKTFPEKFKQEREREHITRCLVGEGQDFYWINLNDDFSYANDMHTETYECKLNLKDGYKVTFVKAGNVKEKALKTIILNPEDIATEKYICILVDTYEEAINAEKYFNSKFYRAGLASKMTSWNMYAQWHSNIPIQDFTNNSDIDWSKSSHEIDMQLYKKYNFTDEEIQMIEEYIK